MTSSSLKFINFSYREKQMTAEFFKKSFSDWNSDQKISSFISKQNSDQNAKRIPKSSDVFATKVSHQHSDQNS
jgi:hypothetical protein